MYNLITQLWVSNLVFYAQSTINGCIRVTQLWYTSDGSMDEGSVYQIIFSNRPVSQNENSV